MTTLIKININNETISELEYVICDIDKSCQIISLFTKIKYRHKGYATNLLITIEQLCKKLRIKTIYLDDCTDNFNKINNIH